MKNLWELILLFFVVFLQVWKSTKAQIFNSFDLVSSYEWWCISTFFSLRGQVRYHLCSGFKNPIWKEFEEFESNSFTFLFSQSKKVLFEIKKFSDHRKYSFSTKVIDLEWVIKVIWFSKVSDLIKKNLLEDSNSWFSWSCKNFIHSWKNGFF